MTGADDDLCFLSGCDAARLIAARELSPVELLSAVLARVEAVQPTINAFALVCADAARDAAREAEAAVMRGDDVGPLHGVPFTVKDMIDVAGLPITWGSHMFAGNVPARDAATVARLRAAGGIVLGITTMPECGPKATTDSPRYGVTRNPWNLERTPGGSSGGAAAALAVGCGALALGTDRAGSVRIPASCCATIGLKTTAGAFPAPESRELFDGANVAGPLTRTAADAALTMTLIAGPHAGDPRSQCVPKRDYVQAARATGDLKGTKIAWAAKVGNEEVDGETLDQCEGAVRQLIELGATVEAVDLDLMDSIDVLFVLGGIMMHALYNEQVAAHADRVDRALAEYVKRGGSWTGHDVAGAMIKRSNLYRRVAAVFTDHDFIVTPTLAAPPLSCDHFAWDPVVVNGRDIGSPPVAWFPYDHPFNHTGHPAISVPCGWTSGDLPAGLQIVGPWHSEDRLLRIAAELEAVRPWSHRRPALVA